LKPKVCLTKEKQIEHWQQKYIQAKSDGDTKLMKIYGVLILKLGGKISKL
jgi:hypothetical protein